MNTLVNTGFILLSAQAEMTRLFDLDFQLLHDAVLMIIAIFFLVLILSNKLFNPARKFLNNRKEKIELDLNTAKEDREQAQVLKDEYELELKDIDKETQLILSDARSKALKNEDRIVAEAKQEAANIISRAKKEAELEKQKVVDDMKKEMITLASAMASKVIKASIDTTVQESLVDETLKEMGENTWQS